MRPALSSETPKERSLPQDAPGQLQTPQVAQFPPSIEAGAGDTGFTAEAMVARLAGMPIQAVITTDEKGSTVNFALLSGYCFSLRQPLASKLKDLKDLELAVASALGLRLTMCAFSTTRDPSNLLQNSCDLKEYNAESLVLRFYDDFGDCRRFLKAMAEETFKPRTEGLQIKWTLRAVSGEPEVSAGEVHDLLQEDKYGPEVPEGMAREFMQVFGRLTSMAEDWLFFRLEFLQNYPMEYRFFKHELTEHWLLLAKDSVTQKVPQRADPVFFLCLGDDLSVRGLDVFTADNRYPAIFRHSKRELRSLLGHSWGRNERSMLVFASLNADYFTGLPWKELWSPRKIHNSRLGQWVEKYEEAVKKDTDMEQGEQLDPEDVVRMMHVQLRLSCGFGVVEVEGELHIQLLRSAATLLQWHLKEVTHGMGVGGLELEPVLKDAMREVQDGMRGVLILVRLSSSHAPADLRLCWRLSKDSVRFILCYL